MPSNRSFGIVMASFFTIVALIPLFGGHGVRVWAMLVSLAFLFATVMAPASLTTLNRWWLKFGLLLHSIISPIVLGVVFFGVVTPIGLLMRALGKDLLKMQYDKAAASYWVVRDLSTHPMQNMKNQF